MNVCPICDTCMVLCVWEILSGSNNRVYMYHVFHWLTKKGEQSESPHRFWSRPMTRNRILFWRSFVFMVIRHLSVTTKHTPVTNPHETWGVEFNFTNCTNADVLSHNHRNSTIYLPLDLDFLSIKWLSKNIFRNSNLSACHYSWPWNFSTKFQPPHACKIYKISKMKFSVRRLTFWLLDSVSMYTETESIFGRANTVTYIPFRHYLSPI